MAANTSLFIGKADRFGGVTIDLDATVHGHLSATYFHKELHRLLSEWKRNGKRGVWLCIPTVVAHFVGAAVELGFDFHHANPGVVMLTKWLPDDAPSGLPAYPHHQFGVGGFVVDPNGERVLCIQERAGMTAGMQDFWKLPGGLVDHGEDICDAAVREVLEETGVKTVFECIGSIRETHAGPFGCTDLYAICILRLDESVYKNGEIPKPEPQEREIAASEWRDLSDFLGSKYYTKGLYGSLLKTAAAVALRRRNGPTEAHLGIQRTQMKGLSRRLESMYYVGGEAITNTKDVFKAKL